MTARPRLQGHARESPSVNEAFVQVLFPHENPLGRRVRGGGNRTYQIIGVVGNIKVAHPG